MGHQGRSSHRTHLVRQIVQVAVVVDLISVILKVIKKLLKSIQRDLGNQIMIVLLRKEMSNLMINKHRNKIN